MQKLKRKLSVVNTYIPCLLFMSSTDSFLRWYHTQYSNENVTLSIITPNVRCCYAEHHYTECRGMLYGNLYCNAECCSSDL